MQMLVPVMIVVQPLMIDPHKEMKPYYIKTRKKENGYFASKSKVNSSKQ